MVQQARVHNKIVICEEKLRELEIYSLEKRREKVDMTGLFKYLKDYYTGDKDLFYNIAEFRIRIMDLKQLPYKKTSLTPKPITQRCNELFFH